MYKAPKADEPDDLPPPQKPPSPPPHTTFASRNIHPPNFSAFQPRDVRIPSNHGMLHVAWSCDGKKLAGVGTDRTIRVWTPEKSIEWRSATSFAGAHSEDVDYVSWNPTHPELFCSSSSRDRRVAFWDARQSRPTQTLSIKGSPVSTNYSPDGRTVLVITAANVIVPLELEKELDSKKDIWNLRDNKTGVTASNILFNHTGDGLVLSHQNEHRLRIAAYPSMTFHHEFPAHVSGCSTIALDPRGRYVASGGKDSIVNLFDVSDWICARTITCCNEGINNVGFSYDGEFVAIASSGNYIDIVATETGMPLHRVVAPGPSPVVAWHPSKHLVAYCGQTPLKEGGGPSNAFISLFGPGMS